MYVRVTETASTRMRDETELLYVLSNLRLSFAVRRNHVSGSLREHLTELNPVKTFVGTHNHQVAVSYQGHARDRPRREEGCTSYPVGESMFVLKTSLSL